MAININSNIINNVNSASILDVYNRQSVNKNVKELAKKPEIKEFNITSVPPRELKDYLSEIEKRAISEIFDGNYVKSSLPEFHSSKVISVGSKLDIKTIGEIMVDPRISAIQQMNNLSKIAHGEQTIKKEEKPEISFKDMMGKYLNDANDLQIKADQDIQSIIAGEDIDPHKVMIAVQKANLSFEMVMEIRNKLLEAYKEVTKMSM